MDKFTAHMDLTPDVGATVKVYDWSTDEVHLIMGGDLSVTVGMTAEAAKLLAHALTTAVSRLP